MRRWLLVLPAAVVLLVGAGLGQSLGDVARQNREKQKNKTAAAPKKVITNETLPAADADFGSAGNTGSEPSSAASSTGATPSGLTVGGNQPSSGDWKGRIQSQKAAIASLEEQIDKLNASIHFVVANEYYNGVQYNEAQAKKQQQVEQMRQQLAEQKQKLAEMQEAARQAGLGSAVYDP